MEYSADSNKACLLRISIQLSRSLWSLAKVVSQNFCYSSFPPLKTTLALLHALLHLRPTFLHLSLLQIPIWMMKNPNLLSTLHPPSQCHLLSSPHARLEKPFSSSTPLNPKALNLCPRTRTCSQQTLSAFLLCWYIPFFLETCPRFPYPQKGDKSDPSNYRPIAITSFISKTMETIITKQLLAFLETNNLLSDHQYGFRQAKSTGDLLAYAVHTWSSALESYGESRVISLDISKAFNRVWHKGLLAKLPMFGLHNNLIKWIASFLSNRSIAIRVDGFLSEPHSINSGVPQGSVISPVLFILFINDLLSSTSSSIYSFADDTYLSSSFSSSPSNLSHSNVSSHRNTSASLLTNDLSTIEMWGNDNRVKFNQGKTTQVVISRKHHSDFPPVFMSGHELDISSSFTQLGLSVSSNLSWKTYIHSTAKHASQKLSFPSRARAFFSPSQLLTIYKYQIRPSLEYCSHVWGGAPRSSLHLLDKVQPKAIRLINNPKLTKSLQFLSHRRLIANLSIFYRYFHGHCSMEIKSIIPDPLKHVRSTRSSNQSHPFQVILSNPRTLSHKSSFIPRTSQLWNTLPSTSFPESYNLSSFKSNINKLDIISLSTQLSFLFLPLSGLCYRLYWPFPDITY